MLTAIKEIPFFLPNPLSFIILAWIVSQGSEIIVSMDFSYDASCRRTIQKHSLEYWLSAERYHDL